MLQSLDPDAAAKRLHALEKLPLLDIVPESKLLANNILRLGGMELCTYCKPSDARQG